jgi:hypothetical protein
MQTRKGGEKLGFMIVVIITIYEPDTEEWVDCKVRR